MCNACCGCRLRASRSHGIRAFCAASDGSVPATGLAVSSMACLRCSTCSPRPSSCAPAAAQGPRLPSRCTSSLCRGAPATPGCADPPPSAQAWARVRRCIRYLNGRCPGSPPNLQAPAWPRRWIRCTNRRCPAPPSTLQACPRCLNNGAVAPFCPQMATSSAYRCDATCWYCCRWSGKRAAGDNYVCRWPCALGLGQEFLGELVNCLAHGSRGRVFDQVVLLGL